MSSFNTNTAPNKPGETSSSSSSSTLDHIVLEPYAGEHQMQDITSLIEKELSEPYIVYTYRYFVNQWPSLCFIAYSNPPSPACDTSTDAVPAKEAVGVVVCKLDRHLKGSRLFRGYIAMISVKHSWRGQGLAKKLVKRALKEMVDKGAQEVVLETEADNVAALALYERLGFIREKRLHRFYLNGRHPQTPSVIDELIDELRER
ncbi:related to MAK3 N-acetyltransferase [Ustilago trichophora]|uniref:Related to MAK3 N-acetyltransferase n=1 Tax=Ustilago trichophora TaxID=86804 RepID=A0A5C3E0M1_9BASI|nr:related to MAK3 N-acetyltransferase [Ustilago trichophora]